MVSAWSCFGFAIKTRYNSKSHLFKSYHIISYHVEFLIRCFHFTHVKDTTVKLNLHNLFKVLGQFRQLYFIGKSFVR